MASQKDIKRHISAVKKTQKLTRAMNMVAAAKLRSVQGRTEHSRLYARKHAQLIAHLATCANPVEDSPLFRQVDEAKKIAVLAFSSDRGLCGSFNSNAINHLNKALLRFKDQGQDANLVLVGRKLRDYYQRINVNIVEAFVGVMNTFDYLLAQKFTDRMIEAFSAAKYDRIYMLYTSFVNVGVQSPRLVQLLPLSPGQIEGLHDPEEDACYQAREYLVEPDAKRLLAALLPRSLAILVYQAMLETVTSEHAARMQAMDNANRNCKDMIDQLSIAYNKARQSAVTAELLDIVGGVEALNAGA